MLMKARSSAAADPSQTATAGHSRGLGLIVDTLMRWGETRRSRYALAQLDDRLLRDVGLSPAEAMREAAAPFWKA